MSPKFPVDSTCARIIASSLHATKQREDIVQIIRRALLASVLLPTVAFAQQPTKSAPPDLNVYSRPAIPEDVAGN